jgi:hypothetical protein
MKRWLIGAVPLLSALLCALAVVAWARSYGVGGRLTAGGASHLVVVLWAAGGLSVGHYAYTYVSAGILDESRRWPAIAYEPTSARPRYPIYSDKPSLANRAGFGIDTGTSTSPGYSVQRVRIILPLWLVALFLLLAPALWLARCCRRLYRMTIGLCIACGYDLRASPERCPECGRASAG